MDTCTLCLDQYERMKSQRRAFDTDWSSIRDLVRPISVSFNNVTGEYQTVRPSTMYDGTAPDALETLASALHSYLTNPAERWFELQVEGIPQMTLDPDSLLWLEQVSDIIYAEYAREGSNINQALSECYLDIGAFGTTSLYQEWDVNMGGVIFSAVPLAQSFFLENSKGKVDTHCRVRTWSLRQIKQEFGENLPKKLMEVKDDNKMFEVINMVCPRNDRIASMVDPKNMEFASVWICVNTKEVIHESGYKTLPYHVARWTKMAGETYGRGPAHKCLPDIRMLNVMELTLIKAGQKQVDPPLIVPNDAFLLPIKTSPGSLIFAEDREAEITPLEFKGNLPWAEDKCAQKRQFINKCFYADWIKMGKENQEMTATEVADRRDEKLRLLAPMLGRLISELHGPMIARTYALLDDKGKLPPAPPFLANKKLKVGYLSSAARAQTGERANQVSRFLQDMIPFAQVDRTIMDVIDMDEVGKILSTARGVPRTIIRSKDSVEKIRDQRNQIQAGQSAASVAEPASNAIKNLAEAQKAGGGGIA